MPAPKQKFTSEFKHEAVRLVQTPGKSCAQIARNLGVPPHYVVRWKKESKESELQVALGRPVFTGRGITALSAHEAQLKELHRELEIARQERDILKKRWPVLGRTAPV